MATTDARASLLGRLQALSRAASRAPALASKEAAEARVELAETLQRELDADCVCLQSEGDTEPPWRVVRPAGARDVESVVAAMTHVPPYAPRFTTTGERALKVPLPSRIG